MKTSNKKLQAAETDPKDLSNLLTDKASGSETWLPSVKQALTKALGSGSYKLKKTEPNAAVFQLNDPHLVLDATGTAALNNLLHKHPGLEIGIWLMGNKMMFAAIEPENK